MTIVPDDKNWTWVLDRECPECGFDAQQVAITDIAGLVEQNAAAWREVLSATGVAERPTPDRWSALEYACHVRDVFRLFSTRLHLMLTQDDPAFANWDQDETAVADRYGEQDPATVAAELTDSASAIAEAFAQVRPDQYPRTGRRSDGAVFSVDSFAKYFVHDPVHHVWDVTGQRWER